jgi:ABC-type polar amino acid transport system ATPase subunit
MIEVVGLEKRHGQVPVLRGVDLTVPAGQVAAIIGPSGSGKSTFLRCLNGLERFEAGCLTIDGLTLDARASNAEFERVHRQVRHRVGMVFQSFELFPHRTVLENVMEGPRYVLGIDRCQAEARAVKLLEQVGMADRLGSYPRHLSGGQQQRVAIARTLAMEPRAVLFDEPTSALDPRMTGEVLAVMSDLAAQGLTMVVVTHAMSFARRVAHVVHVFGEGKVIESGSPEQIFEAPRQEATRALLSTVLAA